MGGYLFFSLIIALLLGLLFFLVGSGLKGLIGSPKLGETGLPVVQLLGAATVFGLSAIRFHLEAPSATLITVIAILGLYGLVLVNWQQLKSMELAFKLLIQKYWGSVSATAIFAYLIQGGAGSLWLFRTGPDNFGWAGAALAICRGDTGSALTSRVESELRGTDAISSFARPVLPGQTSIAQIPSFTDQIAAEFLIGAHRTGIPTFLGDICSVTSEMVFGSVFIGLLIFSVFCTAQILFNVLRDFGLRPLLANVLVFAAILSVGPLSVALEGGYGQLVTMPFFAFAIATLQLKKFDSKLFQFSIAILIVAGASSYFDMLYLAIPMTVAIYVLGALLKQYSWLRFSRRTLIYVVYVLALSWPMFDTAKRLIFGTISNPKMGGWHQGRVMLPDNVLGFFSSLPVGAYEIYPRSFPIILLEVLLSAAAMWVAVLAAKKQRILFVFIMLGYLYLTFSIYSDLTQFNNYRVWKYSAYAAVLMAFVLGSAAVKTEKLYSKPPRTWDRITQVASAALVFSSISSSFLYGLDWKMTSSKFPIGRDVIVARELMEIYDISFGPGFYPASFSLIGDLHFSSKNRGGSGIGETLRTADRDLVVLLRPTTKVNLSILNALGDGQIYQKFELIAKAPGFDAYKISRR